MSLARWSTSNMKGTEKYMTVGGEKYKADELETNARTEVADFDVTGEMA
ncbi:MAG: hypothetical protein ACLRWQ_20780 [Flavonifractor plautii]